MISLENPLVSIVVTSFNTEKYLADCINSILMQTYKNWEIIYVDDCSTDSTVEKMKELTIYNNIIDKVKMFRHLHNYGYGASLYHSIQKAIGDIIAIVDSDDALVENNALDLMVKAHQKNPDVSLVYSDYGETHSDKMKIYKIIKCTSLKPGQTVLGKFKNGKYYGSDVIISHLKTFKKEYYDMTEGVNPKLKKAVDRDIVLKLEEVGKLLHIPHILYGHRCHGGSISATFKHKSKEYKSEVMKMKIEMYEAAYNRRNKK